MEYELDKDLIIDRSKDARLAEQGEHQAVQYANTLIRKRHLPPVQVMTKEIHRRIVGPLLNPQTRGRFAGVYRNKDAFVIGAGIEPVSPHQIEDSMNEYEIEVRNRINELERSPRNTSLFINTLAYAHYELTNRHVFEDGNGRTARHLMRVICKHTGFRPIVIGPSQRKQYLDSLERVSRTGQLEHFALFLAEREFDNYSTGKREDIGLAKSFATTIGELRAKLSIGGRSAPVTESKENPEVFSKPRL